MIVSISCAPEELPPNGFSLICSFWICFPLRSRNFSKKLQPCLSPHSPGHVCAHQPHWLTGHQQLCPFSLLPLCSLLSSLRILVGKYMFMITWNGPLGLWVQWVLSSQYLPWLWVRRRWQCVEVKEEAEGEERKESLSYSVSTGLLLGTFSLIMSHTHCSITVRWELTSSFEKWGHWGAEKQLAQSHSGSWQWRSHLRWPPGDPDSLAKLHVSFLFPHQ